MVAVFARTTVFTDKNPLFKFHCLTMTTTATDLRSRLPTVYLHEQLAFQVAQVLDHWEKNRKTKIANLATPKALHRLDVQCLETKNVVHVGQFVSQLPEEVSPLVGNLPVRSRQRFLCSLSAVRPVLLPRQRTIQSPNRVQFRFEVLRTHVRFAALVGQERFQPKIEPADLIRAGFNVGYFLFDREAHPKLFEIVAFDCDRLDFADDGARVTELVFELADTDSVASNQFPTCLLERDAVVLLDLFEARSTRFKLRLALLIFEKSLIRVV